MSDIKVKIFFSYSHKDEQLCLELQKHLGPLKRAQIISHWYDREIKPGTDWDHNIKSNIKESDIILFLISPDFLNSDYIYENEIRQAIEQHNLGKSIVVPIMLRKCDIEFTPFKHIQGLPTDLEPITSKKWFTPDDAFFDVIEGLKKIIGKAKEKKGIVLQEEVFWNKTEQKNTIEGYLYYLEHSKLRTNLQKAITRIGDINSATANNYVTAPNTDKLEIELLERERKRIAMELHDDIASRLSVIKLTLYSLNLDGEIYETLKLATDEVISSVRKISRSLRMNISDNEFDLKESILELQSAVLRTNKLEFDLKMENIENLGNPQLEINVFRIIQELINNVLQHSKANKVILVISKTNNLLTLSVTDNGIGFSQDKQIYGIGLKNIRSRVQYYNGNETCESSEKGTSFNISIPLTQQKG